MIKKIFRSFKKIAVSKFKKRANLMLVSFGKENRRKIYLYKVGLTFSTINMYLMAVNYI